MFDKSIDMDPLDINAYNNKGQIIKFYNRHCSLRIKSILRSNKIL